MTPDYERASALLRAFDLVDDDLRFLVLDGPPPSKSRPRFSRGRTYRDPADIAAEARTAWHLGRLFKTPMTGNVFLGCIFFRPNRQRIDTDNMLKHVCDAANGIAWIDDSQVTGIAGITEFDPTHPRTVIIVTPHRSTMGRGTDDTAICIQCGRTMRRKVDSTRRTCSKDCAARLRGYVPLGDPVPCEHCGTLFKRTTTAQRLCSPACRAASFSGKRSAARRTSSCCDCGKQLAHNRGGRCRECWRTFVATRKLTAGGLIADDARICELQASKIETVGWTGAEIHLEQIDPEDT